VHAITGHPSIHLSPYSACTTPLFSAATTAVFVNANKRFDPRVVNKDAWKWMAHALTMHAGVGAAPLQC